MQNILFIHCRRGLYQLTKCKNCAHTFECENCDAKLTTYRQYDKTLELVCHQCQTYYKYPNQCPVCKSNQIFSRFGGIEELVEILETATQSSVVRLDKSEKFDFKLSKDPISPHDFQNNLHSKNISICDRHEKNVLVSSHLIQGLSKNPEDDVELISIDEIKIFVHTRIFDPGIIYSAFDKVIFVQAENLLASADYLVAEEMMKALAEVLLQVNSATKVIFDTNSVDLDIFQELSQIHEEHADKISVYQWYINFLEKEKLNREKFNFPPFKNLLLITTQEKTLVASLEKLKTVSNYLNQLKRQIPEVSWSSPYPARFLRRKNMYSHHILVRYPRQYEHFSLLRSEISQLSELYNLQIRLNPRHLF